MMPNMEPTNMEVCKFPSFLLCSHSNQTMGAPRHQFIWFQFRRLLSSNKVLGSCYDVLVPKNPPLPYYVAILLDKKRLKCLGEAETVPFGSSQMGRQLLCVTAEAQDAPGKTLMLATAHLESTKDLGSGCQSFCDEQSCF